jgi:hypothetical protein
MALLIIFCVQNLNQVERKLGVDFGVFSVKGPDHVITVIDSTFSNNKYGDQQLTVCLLLVVLKICSAGLLVPYQ